MRIDVHKHQTEAAMLNHHFPIYTPDLDKFESMLTRNPLNVFSAEDWDILCHLPASAHWDSSPDFLVSDVCELEYQVVHIATLLDDEEAPPFITDTAERNSLQGMRLWSPILCIPFDLRAPLGMLLEKMSCMTDDQERELHLLLEWSYACLLIYATRKPLDARFLKVVAILQSGPIWAAYMRASPKNPPARFVHLLRNRLKRRHESQPKALRRVHAQRGYEETK